MAWLFGFGHGYYTEYNNNKHEWELYNARLDEQNRAVEAATYEKSKSLDLVASIQADTTKDKLDEININYTDSLNVDWLSNESANSSNSMSDTAGTAPRAETSSSNKCDGADPDKLRELYKKQLEFSRLLEECQIRHQSTVSVYERVRKQLNASKN